MKVYLLKFERGVYEAPLQNSTLRIENQESSSTRGGGAGMASIPYMLSVAHNPPLVQHPRLCVDTTPQLNYRGFNVIESRNGTAQTVPSHRLNESLLCVGGSTCLA